MVACRCGAARPSVVQRTHAMWEWGTERTGRQRVGHTLADRRRGESLVRYRFMGTPSHWLVGQGLDTKSNVCPISVQTLSNVCPIDGKVQGMSSQIQSLSRVCKDPVQFKGSWTVIGHGNQGYVQTLSKRILLDCISLLWTMTGQTLDLDILWTGTNFIS